MLAPMAKSRVEIALVGCGFMGSMHAQVYAQLARARLAAVVDPRIAATQEKLAALGLDVPVYATLAELLARHAGIDAVDLCTPSDRHEADAVLALDAGKHLFCEKPLALSLEAADRIVAKAAAKGAIAQVGLCIRFWPEYQALRAFVKESRGGRLLSLSLQRQAGRPGYSDQEWLNRSDRSGGAALDLHIHDTDFVMALLGRPQAVTSRATFDYSGPSHIFTLYHFEGVSVCAEGGLNYPAGWGFRMAFQAVFEKCCIDFDSGASPTLRVTWSDGKPEAMPFKAPAAGQSASGEGNISSLGGYFNELEYFVDCLCEGRPTADSTLPQARTSLEVALAEIQSAKSGRTVAL
jgi:predicted dehydrogenase